IGSLAGRHRGKSFKPTRLTAGDTLGREGGATFGDAGPWVGGAWVPAPGGRGWVRAGLGGARAGPFKGGGCDGLAGRKRDIQGRDAAEFLDRIYVNRISALPIGHARYGVMLREDGFVLDDGVTARFTEHHYLMSTSTANATRVLQHLEHARQVLWPELDVQI